MESQEYFLRLIDRRKIVGLCRAGAAATRLGEAAANGRGLGLTQYLVLGMLDAVGSASQQELSEGLRTDRTTMVGAVEALEQAGLVARGRNPSDRRAYIITITDVGREILTAIEADADAREGEFFGRLSEAEVSQLASLLAKVLTAPAADPG